MAVFLRVLLLQVAILVGLGNCVYSGKGDSSSGRDGISKYFERSANNITEVDIRPGYCVTWSNESEETLAVVNCPYYIADPICNNSIQLEHGHEKLCNHFKRTGPYCGECINGTGPAAFSNGIACADCSNLSTLWFFLYLSLQLFCVTLLYVIFAFFQLRIACNPLNVIVYFSQVVVNSFVIDPTAYTSIVCVVNSAIVEIPLTVYGIWNLDFFRYIIPPICVSNSTTNIHVLMFDYIIAFYPIVLTVVLYVCIELHGRHIRVVVYLWRPFQFCLSKLRKSDNMSPRESIINTFASFLLLAYSKLLYTSLSVLYSENVFLYSDKSKSIGRVLYYDPTVEYFGQEHAPYLFVSFLILTFIILSPILLLIYPTKVCGKCLECCRFPRQDILQLTMDTFQGWYKDGTEGTWDYRPVSSLYMFLRIGVGIASVLTKSLHKFRGTSLPWVVVGLIHQAIGVFFLVVRPYKKVYMNVVDGMILILFGVMAITIGQNDLIVKAIAYLLSAIPLLAGLIYLLWSSKVVLPFLKRNLNHLHQKISMHRGTMMDEVTTDIEAIDRVSNPRRYEQQASTTENTSNEREREGQVGQYGATWSAGQDHERNRIAGTRL